MIEQTHILELLTESNKDRKTRRKREDIEANVPEPSNR